MMLTFTSALIGILLGSLSALLKHHWDGGLSLYQGFEVAKPSFRYSPVLFKPDLADFQQFFGHDVASDGLNNTFVDSINDTAINNTLVACINDTAIDNTPFRLYVELVFVSPEPTITKPSEPFIDFILDCFYIFLYLELRLYDLFETFVPLLNTVWVSQHERAAEMENIMDRLLWQVQETVTQEKAELLEQMEQTLKAQHEKAIRRINARHEADMHVKDQEIGQLKKQLEEKDGLRAEREQTIERLVKQLEEKDGLLTENKQTIERLKEQLEEKDGLLAEKEQTIKDFEKTESRLRELETKAMESDSIITGLQTSLRETAQSNHSNLLSNQALRTRLETLTGNSANAPLVNTAYGPRPVHTPQPPQYQQYSYANQQFSNQQPGGWGRGFAGYQQGPYGGGRM